MMSRVISRISISLRDGSKLPFRLPVLVGDVQNVVPLRHLDKRKLPALEDILRRLERPRRLPGL